ncbi:jg2657 [Pararge aegeria aegeria]|uniref:Jg2657 protein n=1 Tax=Pararge aegeria aegeria TaxID=348720 RepID=A0A8S4RQL5_9NEOP|nr:jg2657 [Pararge aegeria aegeria]
MSTELGERDTPSPARPHPPPATSCNCEELLSVDCQLETKELWDKFHDLGTEMIITKTGSESNLSLREVPSPYDFTP